MLFVYLPAYVGRRTLDALKSVKLETLHDDGLTLEFADVLENGPDGGAGVIAGWGELGKITAYRPASQEWNKVVKQTLADGTVLDAGRAWIGWDRDDPPTPENLLRRKQLGGEFVKLDDGREWLIAVAEQLPKRCRLSEDGTLAMTVTPFYRDFYDYAYAVLGRYTEQAGEVYIDYEYGFDACTRILAMNYRVSRDLVSVLGLIGSRELWSVPATCCEVAALYQLVEKKNRSASPPESSPDSSTTSNGASG